MTHTKGVTVFFLITLVSLSGCDYSKVENKNGFFYNSFAVPMDHLLHWLGSIFENNYGVAIITIVLIYIL